MCVMRVKFRNQKSHYYHWKVLIIHFNVAGNGLCEVVSTSLHFSEE